MSSLETVRKGGCTTYFPEQLCVLFSGNYVCDMNSRFFVFIPLYDSTISREGGAQYLNHELWRQDINWACCPVAKAAHYGDNTVNMRQVTAV